MADGRRERPSAMRVRGGGMRILRGFSAASSFGMRACHAAIPARTRNGAPCVVMGA